MANSEDVANPETKTNPEKAPEVSSWNLPNAITFSRLILAFVVLAMLDMTEWWITCTAIFVFAVSTDFLDGYFARKWNQVTVLGRIMDPFVDKVIIGGTLIFLIPHPESGVCAWLTFIVIGREMFVTGLRSVLEGHGVDFSAKWSGKIKMIVQSITIPLAILSLSPEFGDWLGENKVSFLQIRDLFLYATVGITLYSGGEYTWRGLTLLKAQAESPKPDGLNESSTENSENSN
ncbi:CDP-diacylglycerol--glycerol-3-phosphate 3-phosphatidyltransferase [Thalassoglobus sp.]|uniref:CDP-diacylglycerol--glycerol-3-phosphate 3-phosphatidyltransferase n=1 Tax=Thalassoglobus sp. TaxID=2795869 RepID=UPI003AA8E983